MVGEVGGSAPAPAHPPRSCWGSFWNADPPWSTLLTNPRVRYAMCALPSSASERASGGGASCAAVRASVSCEVECCSPRCGALLSLRDVERLVHCALVQPHPRMRTEINASRCVLFMYFMYIHIPLCAINYFLLKLSHVHGAILIQVLMSRAACSARRAARGNIIHARSLSARWH